MYVEIIWKSHETPNSLSKYYSHALKYATGVHPMTVSYTESSDFFKFYEVSLK